MAWRNRYGDCIVALPAIIFGVLIGVRFSPYPAWLASKLSPMEALRHE